MGGLWPQRARRGEVLIDPLTGMLNRTALRQRVDELAQQSEIARRPIGVVVGDVDLFARVSAAEAALADVAAHLRRTLRAFDLAYRIGDDRFLVILPGADRGDACNLAEILRAAVESGRHGGQRLTMSFGAAASSGESGFDFEGVLGEALVALTRAQADGRNRVWPSPPGGAVLAA